MTRIYECMFLMDNEVVRAGWKEAKAYVSDIVKKHQGKVLSSRRWDERRLSYPIRKKNRATFLLSYCEFPQSSIQNLRRELDLSETIMRYLILSAEAVPEPELELTREESGDDFEIPEVPDDSAVDEPVLVEEANNEGLEGSELGDGLGLLTAEDLDSPRVLSSNAKEDF